jgi:hypothetical protein
MKPFYKEPWPYLMLQAIVCVVLMTTFLGVEGKFVGDAKAYVYFNWNSLPEILAQSRTFGYPLLLSALMHFSPNLKYLPQVQILMYCLSVFVFFAALRNYGMTKWAAFIAASALFYQRHVLEWPGGTMADLPALALAIISVSFVLMVISSPRRSWPWVGLAAFTFLTYQVRPSYLFLLGFIPIAGPALLLLSATKENFRIRARKLFLGLLIIGLLPYIAFCSYRWTVMGHFGLVSFGSLNLCGITSQFMDRNTVKGFDADLQRLATAMIEARDKRGLTPPGGRPWWPMVCFEDTYNRLLREVVIVPTLLFLADKSDPEGLYHRDVSSLTAQESAPLDEWTKRIAIATIKERPGTYLLYYLQSFVYQISFTFYVNVTMTALLLMVGLVYFTLLFARISRQEERMPRLWIAEPEFRMLHAMLILSLTFFLSKVAFCNIAVPTIGRYLLAASVFVPSALALWVFAMLGGIVTRVPDTFKARANCMWHMPK